MLTMLLSSTALVLVSLIFTTLKHPLALGLTLIVHTSLICLVSTAISPFPWFAYILFLVFMGAVLILFIYVASLASNETFKLSALLPAHALLFTLAAPAALTLELSGLPVPSMSQASSTTPSELSLNPIYSASMIYNPLVSPATVFIILYLLLTLIVVVKLTHSFLGPLRPQ